MLESLSLALFSLLQHALGLRVFKGHVTRVHMRISHKHTRSLITLVALVAPVLDGTELAACRVRFRGVEVSIREREFDDEWGLTRHFWSEDPFEIIGDVFRFNAA